MTTEDQNQITDELLGGVDDLNLGELDLTSEDFLLDEVDVYIQANLEDDIVKEALKTGVDLRQYSKQVESELLTVENASIQDYIKESQNIANLHKQITTCDGVLERMEVMLQQFQADLGSISSEIQTLQAQSITMNVKLKNRQAVRGELSLFVDEMVVPESMINHIMETPVTEREFLEALHELDHKINFVKEQSFKEAKSCNDVSEILDKLKLKAIAKIREFLLQKIYQLRKPMTNYQIPQNAMLKFSFDVHDDMRPIWETHDILQPLWFFNEFLMTNERQIAVEVWEEYQDTMSKIYYSYFKSFSSRLMKLQFDELPDKDDLMGVEDTAKRGFFSAKPSLKNRSTIFTLGNRGTVLGPELEAPIIVPHAAQKGEQKYSFESLFRSQQYALVDNSCREYLFIGDFFMVATSESRNHDMFQLIMGKTLKMIAKQVETYVMECYDSIALFLCVHIIHRFRVLMHKRTVPALDKYWDMLLDMLLPRFQYVLKLNIQSIKQCDPQKLGHIDVRPHYITRRYAEFSAAIVGINQSFPSTEVDRLLAMLQAEVENFILRMAAEFPHRKEQLMFLINNYDMMLGVLTERTADDSKEAESFKELLSARTQEFIEEILSPYFGGIMAFVKEAEAAIERGSLDAFKSQERRVTALVRGFNGEWKKAIEMINAEVMQSFTNFKNGTQILQGTLTQLIQYYHRFQKVLSQAAFKNMAIRGELINIHHVMVEVKKFKPNF